MLGTMWFSVIIKAAEKYAEEIKRQSLERTSQENLSFTLECHTTQLNYQCKLYACIKMKTYVMMFGHFFCQKVASCFAALFFLSFRSGFLHEHIRNTTLTYSTLQIT